MHRTLFLSLSLVANAVLVAAYLAAPARPVRATLAASVSHPSGPTLPASTVVPSSAATASPSPGRSSWAAINTDDIDELARRLKAAGFTRAEMREILARRIGQVFSANPGGDTAKATPYWRTTYRYESPTGAAGETRRKQMAEQQKFYQKYLWGMDNLAEDPEQLAWAKRRWGDVSLDKLQALARIESDYQDLANKQYTEHQVRPGETAGFGDHLLIEKERLADIAKVLTPEEYATYELRASPLASSLRYQLEAFQPTEEEYKTIFAIQKPYHDQFYDPQLGPDARKALAAEITAKVSAALGADRALDYDAAVNQNSQDKTASLVARLGLPARVASEVRQVQQDFTQRAMEIRANTQLAPNDRSAQLDTLARQAETQLTAKLGANGFEAYSDIKGDWLRAIQAKGP